jgi:hypothetical protein
VTAKSANFGYAFWKFRWDAYTGNAPHRGYDLMCKWAQEKKKYGAFSVTFINRNSSN